MDSRLVQFSNRFHISGTGQQELILMIKELIQESLAAGACLVKGPWEEEMRYDTIEGFAFDTVIPQTQETEAVGDSVRVASASKRYEDLGLLGVGSMGEVRRVRDKHLKRIVAMKVLRSELLQDFSLLARFIEEAQATAQLQHPGIVPLHDLGQFEDGRYFFTMKEVKGKTLSQVIEEVHQWSRYQGRWSKTEDNWSFRRLLGAFRDVCEAVGYAHSRGVLHRDLKPDNAMVGAHGEVLVVDWGLVKVKAPEGGDGTEELVVTDRARQKRYATKVGTLTGTPMYMSPEQARGGQNLDARSDVYALGAVLYEILSGRPPYLGDSLQQVMELLLEGAPPPLILAPEELQKIWAVNPYFRPPLPLPKDIVDICEKAMARDPQERYQDAEALAQAIEHWLEGEQKREQAEILVADANDQRMDISRLQQQARTLRQEAAAMGERLDPWAPEEDKIPIWERQEKADELELEAERKAQDMELLLQEALLYDPQLTEARLALAESCQRHHQEAETQGRAHERVRAEQMLRNLIQALPPSDEKHQSFASYLKGDGTITLYTDPPGADVRLYQYHEQHRKLVPMSGQSLGQTPLVDASLPMGRYLLLLHKPGYDDVRYPIHIRRQGKWDCTPPGESEAMPVRLPPRGFLEPDDCYVPAGWFLSGGDVDAANGLPERRLWLDSFVIKQFPVTLREYLAFLNKLRYQGREEEALRYAPYFSHEGDDAHQLIFCALDSRSGFFIDNQDFPDISPEWPITHIDITGAQAYAQWFSQHSGHSWHLPDEMAWEKAARGVDGRFFPWGNWIDPTWCYMQDSQPLSLQVDVVDSWPIDKSPYNVRGMGGNVSEWCANIFRAEGPTPHETNARPIPENAFARGERISDASAKETTLYTLRGGAWNESAVHASSASRFGALGIGRFNNVGFRLLRWL